MHEEIIEKIINASPIEQVIGDDISLKRQGKELVGTCPFHADNTPSLYVNPSKEIFKCFACGAGGHGAVGYVMQRDNVSFIEAIRTLGRRAGISVDDIKQTPEEIAAYKHKETLWAVMKFAQEYFVQQIKLDENKAARDYADSRWSPEFREKMGIGCSPADQHAFERYALSKGWSKDILVESGLLWQNGAKDFVRDAYFGRITIPIIDENRKIAGFSCRSLDPDCKERKYINTGTTPIFEKSKILYGFNHARYIAGRDDMMYRVEGMPDAMRLHFLGIENVVATMGTAFTEEQMNMILRHTKNLCFIPDADVPAEGASYGTGIATVIKSGIEALEKGFAVFVREIPLIKTQEEVEEKGRKVSKTIYHKQDPDTYYISKEVFAKQEQVEFPLWYADKIFTGIKKTEVEKHMNALRSVAKVLAIYQDDLKVKGFIDCLTKYHSAKKEWISAVRDAQKARKKAMEGESSDNVDLLGKYGFFMKQNKYMSVTREGDEYIWSNFILEPLFHVQDPVSPKRMFKIINEFGEQNIVEFKQEDFSSVTKFCTIIEGRGTYVWMVGNKEFSKLKRYIYERTESATEIHQMGWQPEGFYAFGNGILHNGIFHQADDYGIIRLAGVGNFYLPFSSCIYADAKGFFTFERKFIYAKNVNITFYEYAIYIIRVFGDNGRIGIAYLIAAVYRDIIVAVNESFPLLNLFGPMSTGKSELGHCLTAVFHTAKATLLTNSTVPSLNDVIGCCSDAIVHLDEYKVSLDKSIQELLKGVWDCVGRTRLNMDRDKKRETTAVDTAVIVSGQEMATADIALFSRFIYLQFMKNEFTEDEETRYKELKALRAKGLSHLLYELLLQRDYFEKHFEEIFVRTTKEVNEGTKSMNINARILQNWTVVLAAVRTYLQTCSLPFDDKEIVRLFLNGIVVHNSQVKKVDEVARFWSIVQFLRVQGEIFDTSDYRISFETKIKGDKEDRWPSPHRVIRLNPSRVFMLYLKYAQTAKEAAVPEGTLREYLSHSPEYLGKWKTVFKVIQHGVEQLVSLENMSLSPGCSPEKQTTAPNALCFDYDALVQKYDLNLEAVNNDVME